MTPEEWARSGMAHGDIELPEGADLLGPDLSDIPLTVLSAGIFGEGMPPDVAERLNRVRLEMQRDLLSLSVNSTWVEKEVETAFEKERESKETVLFPIRLDDSVMAMKKGWPADIRLTRHIGDFTKWKDHDSYQKAFKRLLRDLGKEEKPDKTKG